MLIERWFKMYTGDNPREAPNSYKEWCARWEAGFSTFWGLCDERARLCFVRVLSEMVPEANP